MSGPDILAVATAKLESSGLSWQDAKQLGITFHADASKLHESYPAAPCLKIQYNNPVTFEPAEFKPKWGAYYRVRMLDMPAVGFDQQADQSKKKGQKRYLQEPNSGVMAYFPSLVPWEDILDDPTVPLIITEGEFKAAKACKSGFATIGLGGVHSFRSARYGMTFLPELDRILWVKRVVTIIYDNDVMINENVTDALNELADQLSQRGALTHMVVLPAVTESGKTGLDDFLVAKSAAALQEAIDGQQSLTLAKPLWDLNKEVIYIRQPGVVLVKDDNHLLSPSAFRDHAFSERRYAEQILQDEGRVSMRMTSAALAWLSWPLRAAARKLTYKPGSPKIIRQGTAVDYNTWPGWGVQPEAGDIDPFLRLVDHLFSGADEAAKQWFIQWCAYPLQYPGTKLFTSVLLWGVKHGTGKSLIGETLGKIYGANYTELNQRDLYNGFNEWAENKQFVLADDITGTDKRHESDILKRFITQSEIRLNIKHVKSFTIPDCINYYFTANQPTAFFLEDDDRRSFVHEIIADPLTDDFYMEYKLWKDTTGPSALFDYLLKVDTSDFNPNAPAMRTAAKERMIADVRSDLGEWVARLIANPDDVLKVGQVKLPGDLFTNRDLLQLYDPEGKTKTTANGLGRELRRQGIVFALGGKTVRGPAGVDRYFIIRNPDKWKAAAHAAVSDHLAQKVTPKAKY